MKKLFYLLSAILFIGSSFFLSTCKKDEPDKPTITSLSPATGHEGDVVKINGAFLGSTHKVKFGALEGVVIDPKGSEVTTQVPAGSPLGKIDVSVETEGGSSNAVSFTVIPPAPEITGINPNKGGSEKTIVITGKFFTTAKEVAFGTTKVTTFDGQTETQLTLKVPAGLPLGAIDVTVTSDSGISNLFSFTILAKPTITSFTPPSAPVGAHVFITGTVLEETTDVFFLTVKAISVTITSATLLDVIVPVGALSGKIKVVTTGGEVLSTNDFTVKGPPIVTSFIPTSGIVGTNVTLTGENFSVANPSVKFGNTIASSIVVNSDTQMTAIVPAGATTGKISVTTAAGTGASANDFTVIDAPTVTSFSPVSGFVGTSVIIAGTTLTGATSVKFNGVSASNFTVNSATQITATVPAGATTGTISVTTGAGTGTSPNAFTLVGAPTVTSFTLTSGIVGASITITGTNFTGATGVKFNGVAAVTFTVNSATQITATVPAGASSGPISVTNPAGTGTSAGSFTVTGAPIVNSFTPPSGAVGATVTITGTALTGATSVKFNGVSAVTFTVNSATQITATVPAGASSGPISVTTPGGTGTSAGSFTVIGAPTVTSFTPTSGAVGGSVTITGTSFIGVTGVKFNSTAVVTYTVNSATQITATIPAGATTGVITVTTAAGSGASANSFTIFGPPAVTSFTPTSGAVGQTVVVTGTGFVSVTSVKFNGVTAPTYTVNSATQITVTIPAGATTGKISVANAAGTGTSAANFTIAPAPTVTSFTPTSAAIGGTVTITGTNFIGVTGVKFNGTSVVTFTTNSATQITATVPAGTTNGTISVTTNSGTGTSAASFTVIGLPTITSFAPTSGIAGTSVVITGTNFVSVSSVKFNGVAAGGYTVNNATQITTTAPGGVTTGVLTVVNPAGTATSAASFTAIQAPLIGSISPTTAISGTTLTILGSNLGSATSVKFGGVTVGSLLTNTPSQITVTIPALSPGAVNVSVVTAGGTSNTKTLTIVAAPVISDIKPNVSYKGFPIMIQGSNLAGATGVKIGTYDATIMTKYDATLIATLPGSIPNSTYTVTVLNEGGPSNGVTLNIITAPAGVGSPPAGTYVSPPPANFINIVSNQWSDEATSVAIAVFGTYGSHCQIENSNGYGANPYICGSFVLTKDGAGKVTGNYVELTMGTAGDPPTNLETFYGQWSSTTAQPCVQRMTLISGKDGHVLKIFVRVDGSYPDGNCVE